MSSTKPDPVDQVMWVWAGVCLLLLGGGPGVIAWAKGATDPPAAGAEDFLGVGAVFAATFPLALAAAVLAWMIIAKDRGAIDISVPHAAPWIIGASAVISVWAVDQGVDRQITAAVEASGQSPDNFQVPAGWPDFVDDYGVSQIGGGGGPPGLAGRILAVYWIEFGLVTATLAVAAGIAAGMIYAHKVYPGSQEERPS